MTKIRFFTDEDIHAHVARRLGAAGFDAVSTPEVRRLGESDTSQLDWAVREQRAIVTFNVAHFARLHFEWLRQGKHHSGIIVSQQRSIGDLIRRLINVGQALDSHAMLDRLEYLSNWTA